MLNLERLHSMVQSKMILMLVDSKGLFTSNGSINIIGYIRYQCIIFMGRKFPIKCLCWRDFINYLNFLPHIQMSLKTNTLFSMGATLYIIHLAIWSIKAYYFLNNYILLIMLNSVIWIDPENNDIEETYFECPRLVLTSATYIIN